MSMVNITIDGQPVSVEEGSFVLPAIRGLGIKVPTLCFLEHITPYAACRLCSVEARDGKGWSRVVTACNYPAWEGLEIRTDTDRVQSARRLNLEMLMSRCAKMPVLDTLAHELGITEPRWGYGTDTCILCGLCVRVCEEIVGANALTFVDRGIFREVSTPFGEESESCILCGACADVCPTGHIRMEELDAVEEGHPDLILGPNSAISVPTRQAVPNVPRINPEHCIHFNTGGCGLCSKVCEKQAINYDAVDTTEELEVGSIILATGFKTFDARRLPRYGYGKYPNVYTSLDVERMVNASGPTGGEIRMRDGSRPRSIGIVHCVGSRDEATNAYCSRVCCMYSLKLAHLVHERTEGDVYNFYIDMRTPGKGYEEFYDRLLREGVQFIRGRVAEISDWAMDPLEEGRLVIRVEDTLLGIVRRVPVDMVILSVGLEPQSDAEEIRRLFNTSCSADGWFLERHPKLAPVSTFTDGIFLAGACQGPKDIPDTVAQAGAAAAEAMALIDRGHVEIEPNTAYIDDELCSGCKTCVPLCPFHAITFDSEEGVSAVNEALCKGCGTCVAACPSGVAQQHLFTDEQIYEELEGVLYYV